MRKFSALAMLAALLCFTTGALGQGTRSNKVGRATLSQTPTGLLVLALASRGYDGRDGCGGGGDDERYSGDDGCKAVPEGGATIAYLGLAGLCCLAAAMYAIRRSGQISETH